MTSRFEAQEGAPELPSTIALEIADLLGATGARGISALAEQLELRGVDLRALGDEEVVTLREIYDQNEDVGWNLFVAHAEAAKEFARRRAEGG